MDDFYKGYKHIKEQVLKYNPDIFIHTWTSEKTEILKKIEMNLPEKRRISYFKNMTRINDNIVKETYNPKKIKIEKPKIFENEIKEIEKIIRKYRENEDIIKHNKYLAYRTLSMFHSIYESIDLKKKYEKDNNFKYDCVLLCRFDVSARADKITFDINDNMDYFYFSIKNKFLHIHANRGILPDHWVYSNTHNMNFFCKLLENFAFYLEKYYDYMNVHKIFINNHYLWRSNLIHYNLDKLIRFKYLNPKSQKQIVYNDKKKSY